MELLGTPVSGPLPLAMLLDHITLPEAVGRMQTVAFMNTASLTVLVYDYFLTLPLEIETVWPARWRITKVLFLMTRYLPFIDTSLILIHEILPNASVHECIVTDKCAAWMFVTGIASAEVILTIRAWAVWEQDRRLTIGLPIFFILCWAPTFVVIGLYLKSLKFEKMPPGLTGCLIGESSEILYIAWILLMIYETGIGLLMLLKGIQSYRIGGDSGLFRAVFRDGIIYYLYLAALSITNLILTILLPGDYGNLLTSVERSVHAILTCRVLLQLRHEVTKRNVIFDGISSMESMDLNVTGPMVFTSQNRLQG